jgi:putative membrane protein
MAIERTVLANERTFLSYSRTAMAMFVAGVSFLHFTDSLYLAAISIGFIPVAIAVFIFGLYRFKKVQERIREEKQCLAEEGEE